MGQYAADKERVIRREGDCNKYVHKRRGISEGLLCAFCPHGVCVAFSILSRHEGPRLAFEMIYRRFDQAPRYIVYDNVSLRCLR